MGARHRPADGRPPVTSSTTRGAGGTPGLLARGARRRRCGRAQPVMDRRPAEHGGVDQAASRTRCSSSSPAGWSPTPTASTSTCAAPRPRPPRSPTPPAASPARSAGFGVERGRPGRHAHRELGRGDAGLVGDRGRRRRRRPDQHRLQGRVPAPPAGRLRRPGADRRVRPRRPGRADRRRDPLARARRGPRRRRAARPHAGAPLGRAARAPTRSPFADVRPARPGHVHLHGRHHGPVEGLHAQPRLPRHAGSPDRRLLAAHRRRRGVDAAAAVPLQRHRHRRARPAGLRRPRRRSTGGSRCPTSGPR